MSFNTTFLAKAILSTLLLLCLADMPYGYYQLVRFLGMVGFSAFAYTEYQKSNFWFWTWVCSAVLINPLFKISLGREIWNVIDVLWVILIVGSILKDKSNSSKP